MSNKNKDEMRAEYDFNDKKGIRGKYHNAMQNGYKTIIHKSDGTTEITETRTIFLAPDVQAHFPTSEAVNNALRKLIVTQKTKL
jgi:hypothetical protein